MGRHRKGPVRLNGGDTWYVRLWVKPEDVSTAGKTRLIRSLQTTDHSEALKRYGAAYSSLEEELQALLNGVPLRQRVEDSREADTRPGDASLTPAELAHITLPDFDHTNPTHLAVFESFKSGKPLPITWDEALDLWLKETNRRRPRPVAQSTVYKYKQAVKFFTTYSSPSLTTKKVIRQFLEDHEEDYVETTVAARFRYLSAIYQVLVETDKVEGSNPFKDVRYTATTPLSRQRRPFTDDEIRLIHQHLPSVFHLIITGLRAGEYLSRLPADRTDNLLRIDDQPSFNWRPKTISSYRTVVIPDDFTLDTSDRLVQPRITALGQELRQYITDPTAPLHSARHTYITLARRAGANTSVVDALTGHASKEQSRVAQSYGLFPDDVLIREQHLIWDFINTTIINVY